MLLCTFNNFGKQSFEKLGVIANLQSNKLMYGTVLLTRQKVQTTYGALHPDSDFLTKQRYISKMFGHVIVLD